VVIVAVAADSTLSAPVVSVRSSDASATPAPRPEIPAELTILVAELGKLWAQQYVQSLQAQDRDIVGAWPGTLREARRQVLTRIKPPTSEPQLLDQLARLTNLAARRTWEAISEPDLES
jgi:hypothetical protein